MEITSNQPMLTARRLRLHGLTKRDVIILNLKGIDVPYPAGPGLSTCFCAWGPGFERLHDIMDELVVGDNPPDSYIGCVMTTWHADEALDFFLFDTNPHEDFAPNGCQLALLTSVDSNDWRSAMEQYVSDQINNRQP